MKRKGIIFLLSITVISIGAMFICNEESNVNADSYLGCKEETRTFIDYEDINNTNDSINLNISNFTGQWSFFDLTIKKGSSVAIKDDSNISNGKLYMVILDNNYNIVSKKQINGQGTLNFLPEEDGKYFVRIVGKNASGNFNIEIDSNKEYDVFYKGKFDTRGSLYNTVEKWS